MIIALLSLFTIFFIGYSIFLHKSIKIKDDLRRLRGKLTLGILALFGIFIISLTFIYGTLSFDGYSFKTTYEAKINPETKSVMVGTDKSCDIQIFNPFSDSEHVVFDFTKKPMVELISKRRGAIINNRLLTLKDKNGTKELEIESGDIIRLGYSDYKVTFDSNSLELHNLFFVPSVINLFNIYSTTTLPNLAKDIEGGTLSIWWLFLITVAITFMIIGGILSFINTLTARFSMIGERRYILYPILYFSFFLVFLFLVSIINFTVLQFHQFSVYNKGALYTVLLVYIIMFFNGYLALLGYRKDRKSTFLAFGLIFTILALILLNHNYIYSSSYPFGFNKTIVVTLTDLSFIFIIFGFGFGRLMRNMLNPQNSLFGSNQVNIRPVLKLLIWSIIIAFVGLGFSFLLSEGAGIVLIETIKLFIFFLFTVVLLDYFESTKRKVAFTFWILVAFVPLMIAIVLGLKDMGSLIQVAIAIMIISLFFYNRLRDVNFINPKMVLASIALLALGGYLVVGYIHDNIRLDMWVAPFEQQLEVKNQFYMYYYEQIARGLYLIKQASLFPNNFITETYTPLANLHTDFIFALFLNIFGILGFVAIITAFIITIFSFDESIHLFQNSKKDIYRFIYGVNVIFVAYLFSYIIINMLSVLQIFPLTDVPFPILTYGRGVLILFFVLYIFVGLVNYLYLGVVSRKGRRV
jgi:cell division protein FtsW (lipid II flippase)